MVTIYGYVEICGSFLKAPMFYYKYEFHKHFIEKHISKTLISFTESAKVEPYQKSLCGYSLPKFPSEIVSSI